MKKQLFTLALLFVGAMANAQISKGNFQITGAVNGAYVEFVNGGGDIRNYNISPQVGYFVGNNTSIGLITSYTSTDRSGGITTKQFNYGIYARFHKSIADNLYMYLQPAFNLVSGEWNYPDATPDSDLSGYNISVGGGLTYFVSQRLAIEWTPARLNLGRTTVETSGINGSEVDSDNFFLGFDFSNMLFGLSWYLGNN